MDIANKKHSMATNATPACVDDGAATAEKKKSFVITKRGRAGGRFGDHMCMDCANLLYVGGRNQFTNTKFARPNTQISRSSDNSSEGIDLKGTYLKHHSLAVYSAPPGRGCRDQGNRGHLRPKISCDGIAGKERGRVSISTGSISTPKNRESILFGNSLAKESITFSTVVSFYIIKCEKEQVFPHLVVSLAIRVVG